MPRAEVNLGGLTQVSVGVHYRSTGPFGVRENPQRAESRHAAYVPKRPKLPKRPRCKTCGDRVCVGNCRF